LPYFVNKKGLYVYKKNQSITVKNKYNEIGEPPPLLGLYQQVTSKIPYLFPDALQITGKEYADRKSIIHLGGESFDLRKTMGNAMTAETKGLFEEDAINRIEIICKIKLMLYYFTHCEFGKWKTEYYSKINSHYIDMLVNQLTKQVIEGDEELIDCFNWLFNNNVKPANFSFENPVYIIKNIPNTNEKEWEQLIKVSL